MTDEQQPSAKEKIRQLLAAAGNTADAVYQGVGKMSERLRAYLPYRQARMVFMSPSAVLAQMRINALLDGKELIVPGPGLKDGFFSYRPYTIPPKKLAYAISARGVGKFGKRMSMEALHGAGIDLMVTDAVAVDSSGTTLGHGEGFFDLSVAILAALHALSDEVVVLAAITDRQLYRDGLLPSDPWDVAVDAAITASGVTAFAKSGTAFPQIFWEQLPGKRIKKITPLWKLYTHQHK